MIRVSHFFSSPSLVFLVAIILRVGLLVYGHYQDQWSALKYTDIDYYVFTDAARNVAWGRSPYNRDTYRYTPLLAWILFPTSWPGLWFDFGKVIFAGSDVIAGWLIYRILRSSYVMPTDTALKYASIWLLNPMVAQISTRGSSEGLLIVMIMAMLWAALQRQNVLAGCLLGLAVHFKIYPFIYAASIFWWLGDAGSKSNQFSWNVVQTLFAPSRIALATSSALTFIHLNMIMLYMCDYAISLLVYMLTRLRYGHDFLQHTYLYHVIRSDHRHNFSPYNMLLYLNSSPAAESTWKPEAFAFLPQLLFCTVLLPVVLAKRDLPSCLLAQTFVFVTFNKVCTSQVRKTPLLELKLLKSSSISYGTLLSCHSISQHQACFVTNAWGSRR